MYLYISIYIKSGIVRVGLTNGAWHVNKVLYNLNINMI